MRYLKYLDETYFFLHRQKTQLPWNKGLGEVSVTAGKNKGFKIDLRFVKAVGCGVDANLTRFGYNPIDQAGVLPKV